MLPTIKDAVTAANDARHATAQMLDQTGAGSAETLRAAAASIDGFADRTEQRFTAASNIVESYDAGTMVHDLRRIVRRHPGSFLLAAAAIAATVGYVAGSSKGSCTRV
jgi:hypothetical protein